MQLLVDLCRPSQLTVSPFLRGFYFVGRRTVLVDAPGGLIEEAPSALPEASEGPVGATRVFDVRQVRRGATEQPAEVPTGATRVFDVRKLGTEGTFTGGIGSQGRETREVPQWVFLSHLFSDVLLQDRTAFGTSSASTKVNFWRRFLLVAVAAFLLACSIGFTVSYFRNRALVSEVRAAQAAEFSQPPANQAPSVSDLRRLNEIGQLLDTLSNSRRDGAPLSLRWGLYIGDDLYLPACWAYAKAFHKLLLGPTQNSMTTYFKALIYKAPTDPYDDPYNTLKAYLITTDSSAHAKDDPKFLPAELFSKWSAGAAGAEQEVLARGQFDFYSRELSTDAAAECFNIRPDPSAVRNARAYLNSFPPDQRIYQAMLSHAASNGGKGIDFNKDYPGSNQVVINKHPISPAFTTKGWVAMNDALAHPERYGGGERWVLGDQTKEVTNPQSLVISLQDKYRQQFIAQWRSFLEASRFTGYKDPDDITNKLTQTAGALSPLLRVFCVVSQNTSFGDKDIASVFRPARSLVAADCEDKPAGDPGKDYTGSLFVLQDCMAQISVATPEAKEQAKQQCGSQAEKATTTVRRIVAQVQGNDEKTNSAVQTLLMAPIVDLEDQFRPPPPPGAEELCGALKTVGAKFPFSFNVDPSREATLQEFQEIFQPGTGWLAKHQPPPKPNPPYAKFYHNAEAIQKALYPNGKDLQLSYTIKATSWPGITDFKLTIGSNSLTPSGGPSQFVWRGDPQEAVQLSVPGIRGIEEKGSFDIFRFVALRAEPGQLSGQDYSFAIPVTVGLPTANSPRLKLVVNAGAATQIFQRGSLARLGCTSKVAQ